MKIYRDLLLRTAWTRYQRMLKKTWRSAEEIPCDPCGRNTTEREVPVRFYRPFGKQDIPADFLHLLIWWRSTERFQINEEVIDDDTFLRAFEKVKKLSDELVAEGSYHPTYFETLLLMGMVIFAEAGVDYVTLETGLGGRLDATTAVEKSGSLCDHIHQPRPYAVSWKYQFPRSQERRQGSWCRVFR